MTASERKDWPPGINLSRLSDAKFYDPPNHFDMRAIRLQGLEAGGPEKFWVGLSHILPGGRAGPDSSPLEKVYVILSGELTLRAGGRDMVLGPLDSCCIAPDTPREIINRTNQVVSMLVVLPKVAA
jgi:quercetin dioxygenase-like cupin family protein